MTDERFHHFGRRDFIKYSCLLAGALALPSFQGCAIPRKNVPPLEYKTFLLKNASVVDVVSGQIVRNAWLIVKDGKIAVVDNSRATINQRGIVFDLQGRYLIPGLIDAHCHATVSPVFFMRMMDLLIHARQQKQNFISAIESGITTIRDMGSFPVLLHRFIRDIEAGNIPGPRVLYCNSILNIMGSHPDIPPSDINMFARPVSWLVGMTMNNFKDTAEMEQCLRENARGASFIKLTLDDQTIFCKKNRKIPVYTKDQLDRIFDFSEKHNLPVSGHHQFKFGFDRALEYPFHSIEHMATDAVISDHEIIKMARRNLAIVPTMTVGQSYMMEEAFDPLPEQYHTPEIVRELQVRKEYFEKEATAHCDPVLHEQNISALQYYKTIGCENLWEKKKFLVNPEIYFNMISNGLKSLQKMNQAGILIGCGIDAGMPLNYFGGNYREYEILLRAGFTPIEILRCATINNAKILNIADKTGSLEKGKFADMVVLDTNPLEDIRALRNPRMVFKEGDLMFSAGRLQKDPDMQYSPA